MAAAAGIALIAHFARSWDLFFYDEWSVIFYRRHGGLDAFFAPHNGHLQATLVAIYRVLFATAGLGHYWAYRAVSLAGHTLLVGLLFLYARRRVQPEVALLIAVLVLMMGWAWEVLLWPLNLGFILPLAAFVAVLLLWDAEGGSPAVRWRHGVAGVLVVIALASSTGGVAIAVGLGFEAMRRRHRGHLAAVGIPLAGYFAWFFLYRPSATTPLSLRVVPGANPHGDIGVVTTTPDLGKAPSYLLHLAEGAANALLGLNPRWGVWALLVLAVAIATGLVRASVDRWRLGSLGLALIVFWGLVTAARGGVGVPLQSRYLYPGAVLIALLIVESARGLALIRAATLLLAALVALAVVNDTVELRSVSHSAPAAFNAQREELRSLLARRGVPPAYEPDPARLPGVRKGPLEAAVRDLGYPAGTRP